MASAPTSGPGGGGWPEYVQSATKTLTNAQVKALPTTPVTVVAAPGAGKRIVLVSASMTAFVHTAWALGSAGAAWWQLLIGTQEVTGLVGPAWLMASSSPSLRDTELAGYDFPPFFAWDVADGYLVTTRWEPVAASFENKALVLADQLNGVPDYTGGHATNYVRVDAFYTVRDVPLS